MAALNINCDFKMSQPFTEFTFTWLNNLKSVEGRKAVSYNLKYSFCHQLAVLWTLPPGAAAPISPLSSYATFKS
jgi:hypothetical protein